jgi:type VI secretion system protein ImpL
MKKIPLWLIILWCVMFAAGVMWAAICGLLHFGFAGQWIPAFCAWAAVGVWALIYAIRHPRRKTPARTLATGNSLIQQRISKEVDEAVARYIGSVTRKGLLKKSALYERPWFLACGAKKAGKTSLLDGAGLNFPLRYPSEKDGLQIEGSDQVRWYFGNEAVWIDTPGSFMDDDNRDGWQALLASLLRVRPENPIDGIALVVDAHEVHNADDRSVKDMAKKLRGRVDELIAAWGIEFPVYLIFNHADEIPGFNEYYGDQHGRGQDTIFGSTMSAEQDKIMPRIAFAEEFRLLSKSLTDLRLDKLFRETDAGKRRMICRFVIHFEAMQEKLGAFVAELFKPTNYEGKPIFRGFYFTSCTPKLSAETRESTARQDVGMTIAAHPLNPKKMLAPAHEEPKAEPKKAEVQSLFVLPLFREIMVRDKRLVKTTQKRGRRELIRHYALAAGIALAALVISVLMLSGLSKASALYASIGSDLSGVRPSETSLLEAYQGLDVVGKTAARLQKFEDHGAPIAISAFGFYQGGKILGELNKLYFELIRRLIVSPAVKYYEYTIWENAQEYQSLTGDQYNSLYNSLKTYLSMSEAVVGRPKDIDTAFMRDQLLDAVKQSLLSKYQQQRLPQQIETVLQENMGMYLLYCKRQQFPPVQENQRLVMAARAKLRRLPDAQTLYESVMSGFSQDAPKITLDQMLNRQQEGILKSDKDMSVLYTQEGWDKFVSEGISKTSKDPFKLDWVIGLSGEQSPDANVDTKQLYNDMVAAYLTDFKTKWLDFLGAVRMEPFGDLARSSRMLQKLTADKSELAVLLETVSNYTVMKKESVAEKEGASVLGEASKFKATKALAKNAQKTINNAEAIASFTLGEKSPFDDLSATFDPLRTFTRSTGGALSGYEGYRDKIKTLVEKLATLETQGDQYSITVFSGKDDDPLLSGWKYCQSALANMPEPLAKALRGSLMTPIDYTGDAASKVLGKTLNARWHGEIVKPYTSRFSGRYPFASRGEDASFGDVMDFFRPSTGSFWGFYDRVLSPFVVKTSNGWMVRTVGSLKLTFNPGLSTSLINAERIRDIFFKPDGTQRTLAITLTPSSSNKNGAKFEVNGQAFDFPPGGRSQQINWPVETQPLGASLKIMVNGDFTEDITFNGPWGFMKLIQASHVNKINGSTFTAKWQVNVQNMYVVYQDFRVQVSGNDHPFGDPMFAQFDCPTDLIVEAAAVPKADPSQTGQGGPQSDGQSAP